MANAQSTGTKGQTMNLSHSSYPEGFVSAAGPCFAASSSFSQRPARGAGNIEIDSPSLCQRGWRREV